MPDELQESSGFRTLFPLTVAVSETTEEVVESTLFPEERALLTKAVEKRRREFTTVRYCARQALARLEVFPVPIVSGPHREPLWPEGIVGSLTHCPGYRAAAVSRATDNQAIGIDAELNEPIPDGVTNLVASDSEQSSLQLLKETNPQVAWDRLLFSAKESIYKAWYPLTHAWLDFTQCELSFASNTFTGHILIPDPRLNSTPLTHLTGRWTLHGDHLLTAVLLPTAMKGYSAPGANHP